MKKVSLFIFLLLVAILFSGKLAFPGETEQNNDCKALLLKIYRAESEQWTNRNNRKWTVRRIKQHRQELDELIKEYQKDPENKEIMARISAKSTIIKLGLESIDKFDKEYEDISARIKKLRREFKEKCPKPEERYLFDTASRSHINKPVDEKTKGSLLEKKTYLPGSWVLKTELNPQKKKLIKEVGTRNKPSKGWSREKTVITSVKIKRDFFRQYTTSKGETKVTDKWSFEFDVIASIPDVLEPGVPVSVTIKAKAVPYKKGRLLKKMGVGVSWKGFTPGKGGSPRPDKDVSVGRLSSGEKFNRTKTWYLVPEKDASKYKLDIHIGGWGPAIVHTWERRESDSVPAPQ